MSLRGVWQLQKLVVSFCNWGGSSRGIREFMESYLQAFREKNSHLEVVTELNHGYHPLLKGLYRNKKERVVCVKNMTPMRDRTKKFAGKKGGKAKDQACYK